MSHRFVLEWTSSTGALAELSAKGWGVAVGLPLSIQLQALTQMGRFDEAAECVQSRVPAALFDSVFGLLYLHARGGYSLASGAAEAALSDFLLCGDLMTRWRLDRPALVPWRTGAAQACLRLGQARRAAALAREQLDRLRPGHVRTRGGTLRTLAATADGPRRIHLLQEAVRLLEQCGDHVELARTLSDLGWVFRTIGEHRQARSAVRAARVVMEQCQIPVSPPEPRPVPLDARRAPAPSDPAIDALSPAEVRVAALAAHGHTNREIAKRLFVTVSTIEQQLTRIYRKLGLSGRADLAARFLAPYPVDSTPAAQPRADQPIAARTR